MSNNPGTDDPNNKIIRIEAHADNSFAITADGHVWAWGASFGSRPVQLTNIENVIDISTNYFVKADGTAYNRNTLQRLAIVGKVRTMDEGTNHSVFLTAEGRAYTIGDNTFGQLANGNNQAITDGVVAIRKNESDIFQNITSVEAGDRFTVLTDSNKNVYVAGLGENGELGGNGIITESNLPVKIDNPNNIMLISAGNNHIVVAKTDGTTYSWGAGNLGQLGNRTVIPKTSSPVMVGDYITRTNKNHITLGIGDKFDLQSHVDYFNIIKEENIPVSFTTKDTSVIGVDDPSENTAKITAKKIGTTLIIVTPTINGHPNNDYMCISQVEVIPIDSTETTNKTKISPQVETNSNHTVTLKTNGSVWTYGQNNYGQLGNGTLNTSDEPQHVTFDENTSIVQIATGEYHSVALDSDGNVWTWGRNNYYQLGMSGIEYSSTPIKVTGIPKVSRISAGNNSVMVVTENNKVISWGQNAYGELGTGEILNKQLPTVVEGMHDVLDIQGGKNHYLLLKTNGKMFACGSNLYNQLGIDLGEKTRTSTFTEIASTQKFGCISAKWTSNIAITINGQCYGWGSNTYGLLGTGDKTNVALPKKIENVSHIVSASVGKVHTILRDYNNNIYLAGTNNFGQLGNKTTDSNYTFTKNVLIEDVLRINAGYTYSVIMKEDGTVWAWGDYNHGNKALKSRTNAKVPIQIGSETSSLDKLEIIIKKSETESLLANSEFQFNLIYEDKNSTSDFRYNSLNSDIATVNQTGDILGIREGTTWITATDKKTEKVNVAIVRVIDNPTGYETYTAPKVVTGSTYAAALKENGTVDIWGYDGSGMVDIDVPDNINVVNTYEDLKSGENFIIALRSNGTVWVAGDNTYGQMGIGNNKPQIKLIQIPDLTDIVKIAAGNHFAVAQDTFGITYVWGEGFGDKPVILDTDIRNATSISAGSTNQITMVLPSGEVRGFGSILNGVLPNVDNAVKVEIGKDCLYILTSNGTILKYKNNNLETVNASNAIDVSAKANGVMYQNINEQAFTWGNNVYGQLGINGIGEASENPITPINNADKTFSIGAGNRNTYIIQTNGEVYSAGDNTYGQIGNGTKEDKDADSYKQSLIYTLVGERGFVIEPESAVMSVNDVEPIEIRGNSYNVFSQRQTRDISEFSMESADSTIVEVQEVDGKITGDIKALAEGKTTIDVTDNITNEVITLTRKVVPLEKNRIEQITVNGEEAEVTDPSDEDVYVTGYKVEVPMDDEEVQGEVVVKTNESTDQISVDEGVTWFENGNLDTNVAIPVSGTTLPVTVKTSNGTEFKYELEITRVSNNNKIDTITVNNFEATKSLTEPNVYEIIITDKGDNEVKVTAEKEDSRVSIKGKESEPQEQTYIAKLRNGYAEVPIKVTAESGKNQNYTLKIYTSEDYLKLEDVKVNTENAKLQEDEYQATIKDDVAKAMIEAIAKHETTQVKIEDSEKAEGRQIKKVETENTETEVTITLEATLIIDGQEETVTKDYTLNIYKNRYFSKVQKVKLNDEELEEENNTFTAYVLSNVENANIEITAKDENNEIVLDEETGNGILTVEKEITLNKSSYSFTVDGEEYTIFVVRGESDVGLKKVIVGSGDYVEEAEKTEEEIEGKPVYEVKILEDYPNVDITAQTSYKNSKVSIEGDELETKVATKNKDLTNKVTEIPILVKSEDEASEQEYILRIIRQNDNTNIEQIAVNELKGGENIVASVEEGDDTQYTIQLTQAVHEVEVIGITENDVTKISINGEEQTDKTQILRIPIESVATTVEIKVTSEAETEKTYYLTINTISDDATLEKVTVDGVDAKWNNVEKRYEIKVDRGLVNYTVEATSKDENAKVTVNGETVVHVSSKQIDREVDQTDVIITVNAPNEISEKTYPLAIIEKSNNKELGYVKVNGKALSADGEGNYYVEVVSTVRNLLLEIGAEDANASIDLDGEKETGVWKKSKAMTSENESYDVFITAEDGVTKGETFKINVKRLDGDTDLEYMKVTYTKNEEDTTVELEEKTDGTYYIKIPRIEGPVILDTKLKKETSTINILGTEAKGELRGYLPLTGDVTTVPIIVTAEDGTILNTNLVVEKESNNTEIGNWTVEEGEVTGNYEVTVDSKLEAITMNVTPKHENAKIKLEGNDEYSEELENIEVNIVGKTEIEVEVLAEDGETTETHTLQIHRSFDTSLISSTVNDADVTLGNNINIFTGEDANIVLTARNDDAEIYLLKDNVEVGAGVGTLTTTETVGEEEETTYTISVKGPDEYSSYESTYTLKLRKQSTNTNAVIKLDGVELTLNNETGFYETVVIGAEHTIAVEKESDFATTKIEGITASSKNITLQPEETKEYSVIVTSETEEDKEYKVKVYRKNDNIDIEKVKVKLNETDEYEEITASTDGSYYKKVNRHQENIIVNLIAKDEKAKAKVKNTEDDHEVTETVDISKDDEITDVELTIIAEDGTERTVNLKLEKESKDVTLKTVQEGEKDATKIDDENYEIEVDSRITSIEFTAIPNHENATIKFAGAPGYESTISGAIVDITDKDEFVISVLAEDGETAKDYTIEIKRVFNADIKTIKVDNVNAQEGYSSYVQNIEEHTIDVASDNETAVVTILDSEENELVSDIGAVSLTDTFAEDSKVYTIKVAGTGEFASTVKTYTLTVNKKSKDNTAKIYIENTELELNEETGTYQYITRNSNNNLKVITTNEFAKISVNDGNAVTHEYTGVHNVNTGTTVTIPIVVTSQNGENASYTVELIKLQNNTNIASMTVNTKEATKVTEELYRSPQAVSVTNGHVVIVTEDGYAEVKAKVDGNIYNDTRKVEFDVALTGSGAKKVEVTVTAQDGTEKEFGLDIVQNPDTEENITVKVNDILAEKIDSTSYKIFVGSKLTATTVQMTAENPFTTIRVGTENGNDITFTKNLNSGNDMTQVPFTVTSELGDSSDCVLYIIKESTDNKIGKVYVNNLEITKGDNGRYKAYIENTTGNPTVKVTTNNEYAYARIGNFQEAKQITEQVVELEDARTTEVPITIRSQSGETNVEYLDLVVTFVTANIDQLVVDDIEITDYNADTRTFTALVENNIAEHEVFVVADNNYMTLELAESVGIGTVTSLVKFESEEEIKYLTLYVTGETHLTQTYTIVLAQKSSNVRLKHVKVNDVSLTLDETKNQYRKNINKTADKAKVEVTAEYPYATVKVEDSDTVYGTSGEVWVDLNMAQEEITIPVVVTAADGNTIETYNIILTRKSTSISGKVITENYEEKHIAKVYLYRTSDTRMVDDEVNPREVLCELETNADGTYVIEAPNEDMYDLVIKKNGYLVTTIKNITVRAFENANVQEVKLIAGDVLPDGEIEISDLVGIGDKIGVTITDENKEADGKYDLNEDGVVDNTDRNILKANYTKKAEVLEWDSTIQSTTDTNISTTQQDTLIKPISCEYEVTSLYGMRIHPVTGEEKMHTGIDLSGVHHTEVHSIADGEVTFAGDNGAFGNSVEIKHVVNGETIYSFYAHLSQINVTVGQTVSQGQMIGLEGGAESDPGHGSSTGHHLHFEIRTASGYGNDVDPSTYLNF